MSRPLILTLALGQISLGEFFHFLPMPTLVLMPMLIPMRVMLMPELGVVCRLQLPIEGGLLRE